MLSDASQRLNRLEGQVLWEMQCIETPVPHWLPPETAGAYNVVIVGAGMSGLAAAFGLARKGIPGVTVIEQASEGQEGPWVTSARMKTLRSPKTLSGPDLGIPSLTPRAWYEAKFGEQAYQDLGRMHRAVWMDYLTWFRKVTGVRVENNRMLVGIEQGDCGLKLSIAGPDGERHQMLCRQLVLANGLDGCGAPRVPHAIATLPKTFWTHSAERAADGHLEGKDVLVLGCATSSFDCAVSALEMGARSVVMMARAKNLPRTEILAWTNFPGYLRSFADLPDWDKWRFTMEYMAAKVPPTQDQYDRARSYSNFSMRLDCKLGRIAIEGGKVRVNTSGGDDAFDHLLLGTGYCIDFSMRNEFSNLVGHFSLWRDRFQPPADHVSAAIDAYPYLGRAFELEPLRPTGDNWVTRVRLFNGGALASLGPISNGITGMKYGVPRLVDGIVTALFTEGIEHFRAAMGQFGDCHFDPGEIEGLS